MKLIKKGLTIVKPFFYPKILSFANLNNNFFNPPFSNLIYAFTSAPLPSIFTTSPFPNLICSTTLPTTSLLSNRLLLFEVS